MRVGLNSGRVIAGEIGSGSLGYAATGQQVGMAQRMESVAPPGGVLLSESTAQLVEHLVLLGDREQVHIKGADEPVSARRLVAIKPRQGLAGRAEASLVGRRPEMAALDALVDRTIGGRGGVVNVVGPPGIGKSRMAREAVAAASGRAVEVVWTFCESHTRDIPFHAVTRLLRAGTGVADLDGPAARARVREQVPAADPQDLLLLDDLLGIADPEVRAAPDRSGRAAAPVDRTDQRHDAGPHRTGVVHHRGCALDRCGQRVDAGRLLDGDPPGPVDGADHLPPRIPGGVDAGGWRADDNACPTG